MRASFLLRLLIGAWSVLLVVAVVALGTGTGWTITTLALAAGLWFVGIELDVLSALIERWLVRGVADGEGPVESIWFVDVDAERERKAEARREDTSDNPTIR